MDMEFDAVELNLFRGTWYLTVGWGTYRKTFAGGSRADCINELIAWCKSR